VGAAVKQRAEVQLPLHVPVQTWPKRITTEARRTRSYSF